MGRTVLVVEHDSALRDTYAGWLEQAGYEAEMCPGPDFPDYDCIGGRGGDCPLARAVDVVVLDMNLAPDEVMVGTPAWHLLCYYVERHLGVVALSGQGDFVHPLPDEMVRVVRRPPTREILLSAVGELAQPASV